MSEVLNVKMLIHTPSAYHLFCLGREGKEAKESQAEDKVRF